MIDSTSYQAPQSAPVPSKSKKLNYAIKILVTVLAVSWLLYVFQILGFILLGETGYIISILIRFFLVAIWQPLTAVLLILIVLIAWKKILAPKQILILAVFTLITPFLPIETLPYLEYTLEIIGFALAIYALHAFNRRYKIEIGHITILGRILPAVIAIVLLSGSVTLALGIMERADNTAIQNSRDLKTILNTPSDQLTPEELVRKNVANDHDLETRMNSLYFYVFDQYSAATPVNYKGLCVNEKARMILDIMTKDSPQHPVCKDSATAAIIFAYDNQGQILCVDAKNNRPIILSAPPKALACR